jgi:hypothetical protein
MSIRRPPTVTNKDEAAPPNVTNAAQHHEPGIFRPGSGKTLVARAVNGEPGMIAFRNGAVIAVLALTVKQGLITRLYARADPRKLAHARGALDQEGLCVHG